MRKKILVVDDDPEALELIRFNLKRAGFAIGTAANGVEALKKVCSLLPDLVLLDLMMPELDGFAVCEILRRDPATNALPIIIVSAVAGEMARFAGLGSGANGYITKPFSPKKLVAQVEEALSCKATTPGRASTGQE